jgi:DNA-binding NtrC family response regulator
MTESQNRRILLIDDMPAIHADFRKILVEPSVASDLAETEAALFGVSARVVSAPFELDSAMQGREGAAKVRASLFAQRPYAMAFVDMRIPPGWHGVETIEHLWQEDPRLQVVLCTAYSDYSWDAVLERLDARDRLLILKKPFDSVEVFQLAATLTAKWERTERAAQRTRELEDALEERNREVALATARLQAEIDQRERLEGLLAQPQQPR